MSEIIQEIKKRILDDMYIFGFDRFYWKNLMDLLPDKPKNQIKKAIIELENDGYIKVFGGQLIQYDHYLTGFTAHFTDIGILKYESFDLFDENKYSIEIARFLQIIDETEEDHLNIADIIEKIIEAGSNHSSEELNKLLHMIIEFVCDVNKAVFAGSSTYSSLIVSNPLTALTDFGKAVLNEYRNMKELFQKPFITNRNLVIDEYNNLKILIENRLWKDACIKMGSILEYLLTRWIESKNIPINQITSRRNVNSFDKVYFSEKIDYYLQVGSIQFQQEIGKKTEWRMVNDIIRDYRNFIHLQKYEESINDGNPIEENDFNLLHPAFNSIFKLC